MPRPRALETILMPILDDHPEAALNALTQNRVKISVLDLRIVVERRPSFPSMIEIEVTSHKVEPRWTDRYVAGSRYVSPRASADALPDLLDAHIGRLSPLERLGACLPDDEESVPLPLVLTIPNSSKTSLETMAKVAGKDLSALVADILEQHVERNRRPQRSQEASLEEPT